MSFDEIANQRLLHSVAGQLGELTWDVEPDGYQRLKVPPSAPVDALLRLLLRRGLEPALASMLLERFADRPLERALIAWDVAAGALLGGDEVDRLRNDLAPLKQLGTSASVAVPRDRVAALIEAAAGGPTGPQPTLAAVATSSANDTADIEAALAFADRLALAHLPSLALAFTQILWARHAVPAALDRLVEIALDYERFDSIPVLPAEDDRSVQRQIYFGMRVALAQLDTDSAAQMSKHPSIAGTSEPTVIAARAELDVLTDTPIAVAVLEPIAPYSSTWRYGSRVRDQIRIQIAPQDAAITVNGFVGSFGHDMRLWAQAGLHPELRAELLALLSREVRYQSHDPDVWRAFAVFLDDGLPIELELQQRSAAQLAAVLA